MLLPLLLTPCLAVLGGSDPAPPPPIHFTLRGRWEKPNALTVHVDPAGAPVAAERFEAAIAEALAIWAGTGVVGFRRMETDEGSAGSTPDITISWRGAREEKGLPFLHGHLARTGPVGPGAFIHFNRDHRWTLDDGRTPALLPAALHEIGHVLGLGHSSNPDASLYSQYGAKRRSLSPSDLAALHTLYGGGSDGPGDLQIVDFNPVGRPTPRATPLRRVAPPTERGFAVLDLDGDGRDEICTWPRKRDLERGFLVLRLDVEGRATETLGPFPLALDSSLQPHFGYDESGVASVVQVAPNGRYSAAHFTEEKILPLRRIPRRASLILSTGLADRDGDGEIDAPLPAPKLHGWRIESSTDLDGDGISEWLGSKPGPNESDLREWAWLKGSKVLHRFSAHCVAPLRLGPDRTHWVVLTR
ncbi:MAG: matrixin family metalloprotease [Planctomycetota bacterium]